MRSRQRVRQRGEHSIQPTRETVAGLLRLESDASNASRRADTAFSIFVARPYNRLDALLPNCLTRFLARGGDSERVKTPGGGHDAPRSGGVQPIVNVGKLMQFRQRPCNGVAQQRFDGGPYRGRRGGGVQQGRDPEEAIRILPCVLRGTGKPFEPALKRFVGRNSCEAASS